MTALLILIVSLLTVAAVVLAWSVFWVWTWQLAEDHRTTSGLNGKLLRSLPFIVFILTVALLSAVL